MTFWAKYSFVRLVFAFIIGIILYFLIEIRIASILYVFLLFLAIIYFLLWYFLSNIQKIRFNFLFAIIAFLSVSIMGYLRTMQHDASNKPEHLLHEKYSITHYKGIIVSEIQTKDKNYKTELQITATRNDKGWKNADSRIFLYLRKDSTLPPPTWQYGDELLINNSPERIENSGNPQAFDYANYARLRNIYFQDFIRTPDYQIISHQKGNVLLQITLNIRSWATHRLEALIPNEQSLGIASALLLGVKDHLDNETMQAYAGTGLMHVLAVSGLHIVFIAITLGFLLSPLKQLPKGKFIFAFTLVVGLWLYAFITGLSPSVLRAVVMFSLITIAQNTSRRSNIYNTLAVSAFLLLWYDPFLIYSVGFQLSYLAVLGIAYLYPKIYAWQTFRYKILNTGWSLVSVSLAAQITTFPLGLLYFHQFPNYFLVSNLLILPITPPVMYLGVATLLLGDVPYLNKILGWSLSKLIEFINFLVFQLQKLPFALSEGVVLNLAETFLVYSLMVSLLIFLSLKKYHWWVITFVLLTIFSFGRLYQHYQNHHQKKIVIYNLQQGSNISFLHHSENITLLDSSLMANPQAVRFAAQEYLWKNGHFEHNLQYFLSPAKIPNWLFLKNFPKFSICVWENKRLLFVRKYLKKEEWKILKKYNFDYCIFQRNAVKNLVHVTENMPLNFIILDNSNNFYTVQNLTKQADSLKIPLHNVREQGAFILEVY